MLNFKKLHTIIIIKIYRHKFVLYNVMNIKTRASVSVLIFIPIYYIIAILFGAPVFR